jgi:hypothetical protein
MQPTVVYVHGNGNKSRKESLKAEWDRALFDQDMGARTAMAYWAHLRYPEPLPDNTFDELAVIPEDAVLLPGEEAARPSEVAPGQLLQETLAEARLQAPDAEALDSGTSAPDGATSALDTWLQRMAYGADAVVEGEDAATLGPGLEALPLPRSARVAIFRALVKITFKDVYAYFFGGFAEAMRDVLRKAIADADGPVVVVSHSLGTIIAYDVLREDAFRAKQVPLFLTLGSPLAVTEVQDLVTAPLLVPAGVQEWRNVADARDLVALDSTVRPEYDPERLCSDFLVVNDSGNHHGIREYLATTPVRSAVRSLVN